MRTIKFRAWDLKKKSLYKPTYKAYDGQLHDISITLDGIVMERNLQHSASMLNNENYILMQFTGLTDVNNKEIYEGDILKRSIGYSDADRKISFDVVGFKGATFTTKRIKPDVRNEVYLDNFMWHTIEIIGNIYENPELLKD